MGCGTQVASAIKRSVGSWSLKCLDQTGCDVSDLLQVVIRPAGEEGRVDGAGGLLRTSMAGGTGAGCA